MKSAAIKDHKRNADAGRLPTIHDVADALGMHKSTVSLALSGKGNLAAGTRTRVISVARELGYEPNPLAQRLAKGHQNPAICIFSGVLDVGLATEKILLIQRELSGQGYDVPIYTCSDTVGEAIKSQTAQIRQLVRQRPRAIICAAQRVDFGGIQELDVYQKSGGIVVSYDLPVPLDCDQVIFDREDNAYQAARYLLDQGHRKIGINIARLGNETANTTNAPYAYRLQGYLRALQSYRLPINDEWMIYNSSYERGGFELAQQFLALKDRPSGMCIVNEYVALAFMTEIIRAGIRVPEDLSIVGHDDQPIASYCPVPLTSATQPTAQIASAVVALLQERFNGSHAPPQHVTVKGQMIERNSVAALPVI